MHLIVYDVMLLITICSLSMDNSNMIRIVDLGHSTGNPLRHLVHRVVGSLQETVLKSHSSDYL